MKPIGWTELHPPKPRKVTTRAQLAYEAKLRGLTWREVMREVGYQSAYAAMRAAKLYAGRNGKPNLAQRSNRCNIRTKGQRAYELRTEWGFEWKIIAQFLGQYHARSALVEAQIYAVDRNLPVPFRHQSPCHQEHREV